MNSRKITNRAATLAATTALALALATATSACGGNADAYSLPGEENGATQPDPEQPDPEQPDPGQPDSAQPGDDSASAEARFNACLVAHAIPTLINDDGQIAVPYTGDTALEPGMVATVTSTGGPDDLAALPILISADNTGTRWVVPRTSAYFEPGDATGQAWAACEMDHPDLTQPEIAASEIGIDELHAQWETSALNFAIRAREAGFTWAADPQQFPIFLLPASITPEELDALLDTVLLPTDTHPFGAEPGGTIDFDWRTMIMQHPNARSIAGVMG
jgi:hypothetical protein